MATRGNGRMSVSREGSTAPAPATRRAAVRIEASTLRSLPERAAAILENLADENRALVDDNRSLRDRIRHLEKIASIDPLTGLANRRRFDDSLQQEMRRSSRNNSTLAVAMLDVDHFKRVNDSYGHAGGDAVLRAIGKVLLNRARRGGDLVARVGGEEFAILLPGAAAEKSMQLMEVLREDIARLAVPVSKHDRASVHASIGVTNYIPSAPCDSEAVIAAADKALYRAKRSGRNRVRYQCAPI
jgi:diguanylate cyclase (GGDEF)-like protein